MRRSFLPALCALLGVFLLVLPGMIGVTQARATELVRPAPSSLSMHSPQGQPYLVLCYHSVPVTANGSSGATSTTNFAGQLAWLRANGYTFVSMDQVLQARAGKHQLPVKSILLTVDDGYEDFYTNVFPLLKLYKIPAVFALVGSWIDNGRDPELSLTDPGYASQHFVTWAQVREMADSGLVEMASHSFDLHHGILANPQRNLQPAAVTQHYFADKRIYETLDQRRLRVRADLLRNSELIAHHTGRRPRIMVWPYGEMDKISMEAAATAGMPINFNLSDDVASTLDIEVIPRILIGDEMALTSFTYMLTHEQRADNSDSVRAIKLNLDRIYDPDPEKQDLRLGLVLDQMERLGVNTVLLQPFVTPAPGQVISEAYFPNTVLPMRADLLNRVAWQFHSRLGINVFMVLDTTKVARLENGIVHPLKISDAADRERLLSLYSDMNLMSSTQGLMFDGAPVDADQFEFNAELLRRTRYARPPLLYYSARDEASARDIFSLVSSHLPVSQFDRVALPAPVGDTDAKLRTFVRQMAPDRRWILVLPVNDADDRQLKNIVAKIAFFQRHGVTDFILDGDAFVDDPSKFDMVRKAVSLKANPLLSPGR